MESAAYSEKEDRVQLTEKISSQMPDVNFKWVNKALEKEKDPIESTETNDLIQIPVYLNTQRTNLITSVKIATYGMAPYVWYQRGVALFAWSLQ